MSVRRILIFVCALFVCSLVHAEPENVLVGEFTFTRPEEWTWDSPDKSKFLARFILPHDADTAPTTDVRFYITQMNAVAAKNVWKSYFPQTKEDEISMEKRKIGKHDLTYISIEGTQIIPGHPPKAHYTFFGAVIPSGKDFVHVRLFGPNAEVEKATPRFKKMVESALQETE